MSTSRMLTQAQEAIELTRSLLQKHHTSQPKSQGHNLSSALAALSAALSHTETLLWLASATEAPQDALISISKVLSECIPVLKSHLHAFSKETGRNLQNCPCRRLRDAVKQPKGITSKPQICESINFITTSLIQSSDLMDSPHLTTGCISCCCIATNDPKHPAKAPLPDRGSDQRLAIVPRGRQTDRENQNKHVHCADHPSNSIISELPGSFTFPAEFPGSILVRPLPKSEYFLSGIDRRCRSPGPLHTLGAPDQPNVEAHVLREPISSGNGTLETDADPPLRLDLLSSEPASPPSPPPPYSLYSHMVADHGARTFSPHLPNVDIRSASQPIERPTVDNDDEDEKEIWADPITQGCRRIMQERFPTTTSTIYDDYITYREQVRSAPAYKWYLNFRYLSFVFQPDLPMRVFLVDVSSRVITDTQPTAYYHAQQILACLFEDCIVFAQSPFVSRVPDPNSSTFTLANSNEIPLLIESGLEVLEDQPLRFCHIRCATELDKTALLIESSYNLHEEQTLPPMPTWTKLLHITFQATCQRRKVAHALKPWLEENPRQRISKEDAHSPHNTHKHCHYQHRNHVHSHNHPPTGAKKQYPHHHFHHHQHRGHQHQRNDQHSHQNLHSYHEGFGEYLCTHDETTPRHHTCHRHRHNGGDMEFSRAEEGDFDTIALDFALPIRLSRSGIF